MGKKLLIKLGLVGLFVLMGFARAFVDFVDTDNAVKAFTPHLPQYLALSRSSAEYEPDFVRGRMVIIDSDDGTVDYWTYPKLPAELRAQSPEQVGTVGFVRWGWRKVGDYQDGNGRIVGDAEQSYGVLTLVDWSTREVIGTKEFLGAAPVDGFRAPADRVGGFKGERPMFDVVSFIESLPRRD